MDAFFVHIFKSSALLILFLSTYYIFLKKETFFTGNRLFLIAGMITSLLLPFISLTRTIYIKAAPSTIMDVSDMSSIMSNTDTIQSFDWINVFLAIYMLGMIYFTCRLILQLRAIQKIKKNSTIIREDNFYHVHSHKRISPFSFFKYIFYHPHQYSKNDLKTILTHEKVHATGLHSMDIILTEIVCILQWFNPAVWFYKSLVKQNLEFLADSKTCRQGQDKRNYQYLLLQQVIGNNNITIVNPFFNSIIKKRIVMLNQNQSRSINLLKLFIVFPFLVLFLVGFNTKEVVKFSSEFSLANSSDVNVPIFKSPLKQDDILRVSSGFGPAKNPFSKKMEYHSGIDIIAKAGKDVRASASGTIVTSGNNTSNGNYIVIAHTGGYRTKYLHLEDRSIEQGEKVRAGQIIGHVGNTGKSTGTHLHFEILKSGKAINPESLIPFKTKRESINSESEDLKKMEFIIDKDTSDEELKKIKKDLAKDGIDFSYTVVHNDKKEIIDISIHVSGKGKNGSTFNNTYSSSDEENVISPLVILIDPEHNLVSIGSKGNYRSKTISIDSDDNQVWISSDGAEHKEIRIKKENGKKIVIVDGKEVREEDLDEMEIDEDGSSSVFIHTDSEDEHDVKVISKKGNGFFFIDSDGVKNPLYRIDGKESSSMEIKELNPSDIESINILKGENAIKKYGQQAEDGVVEIITKGN